MMGTGGRGRRGRMSVGLALLLGAASATPCAHAAALAVHYEIEAGVDVPGQSIAGRMQVRLTNRSGTPLSTIRLHLFPNRFRVDGPEISDINRRYVYPDGDFDPGGITIREVSCQGRPATATDPSREAGRPPGTLLEFSLPRVVPAGASARCELLFDVRVPERFGPFGVTEHGLAAAGGWHPLLVARSADGAWRTTAEPPLASFDLRLRTDPSRTTVIGSAVHPAGHEEVLRLRVDDARTVDLLVLEDATHTVERTADTAVEFVQLPSLRTSRVGAPAPEPGVRQTVLEALRTRPASIPAPATLRVVEAPLRWNLTAPSDQGIVLSDRALHVHAVLRDFHDAQIARAVYRHLLAPRVIGCAGDGPGWAADVAAWTLADRFVVARSPNHMSVHEWISWLDVFAIVDRFEKAPKVPFVQAFFQNSRTEDDLAESVLSWTDEAAPARMVLAKLRRELGERAVEDAIDAWLASDGRCVELAGALAEASGRKKTDVRALAAQARRRPPAVAPNTPVDPTFRPLDRPAWQVVLDSADVEVSSSQFGVAGLFVARRRYDYTRDISVNPFFSERKIGVRAGPRWHFGPRRDAALYRHNVFAYYEYSDLRRSFRDDRFPDTRQDGQIGGFGLRYDYSNVFWFNHPSDQRKARVFVDWYDRALGSDFDFVRLGARASATTPLGSYNTIGAIEVLAGFEIETSDRGVPVQERFSLGGLRAIRGIEIEEKLARNIGLVRAEIRQEIHPIVDLDFLGLVQARQPQIRFFVDTGQVDDSAGRALNPGHWAVGAGVGLALNYDFLGFFPGLAYIEIATRLDRDQSDVQFLFGSRQAF